MSGLQADEQVNMIFNAANRLRDVVESANCPADVLVETFDPGVLNPRFSVFGAEDDVEMQAGECGNGDLSGICLMRIRNSGRGGNLYLRESVCRPDRKTVFVFHREAV